VNEAVVGAGSLQSDPPGRAAPNAETVSLLYAKVDFEYKPPKADGSLDVGEHFRFDVKNNTSW